MLWCQESSVDCQPHQQEVGWLVNHLDSCETTTHHRSAHERTGFIVASLQQTAYCDKCSDELLIRRRTDRCSDVNMAEPSLQNGAQNLDVGSSINIHLSHVMQPKQFSVKYQIHMSPQKQHYRTVLAFDLLEQPTFQRRRSNLFHLLC